MVLPQWKLRHERKQIVINNSGPIFCDIQIKAERNQQQQQQRNMSEMDFKTAEEEAPKISFKEAVHVFYNGGVEPKQWHRLENVRFDKIDQVFQFKDENNQRMTPVIDSASFMLETGEERAADFSTDTLTYFLRIRVQDVATGKCLWMSGFDKCGVDIFSQDVMTKYQAEPTLDVKALTDALRDVKFDILISGYASKTSDRTAWTIESIADKWEVEEETDEE